MDRDGHRERVVPSDSRVVEVYRDLAVHPGVRGRRRREIFARPCCSRHGEFEIYRASYSEVQLVGAVKSVLSLLGWGAPIQREFAALENILLGLFGHTNDLSFLSDPSNPSFPS